MGGSIMVFGWDRDVLDVAHQFAEFLVEESCRLVHAVSGRPIGEYSWSNAPDGDLRAALAVPPIVRSGCYEETRFSRFM